MFKVKNKDTRRTPLASSGIFFVNFEHISQLAPEIFLVDLEQVNVSWVT